MTSAADREGLVRGVVRLRRAERLCAPSEDVAAVREDLERRIGPTVRRALAARLLGVSQTALDRWVARGDIPTVLTPTAGREVALHVVVDLAEAVEEARRSGTPRHALAVVLRRRDAAAQRLDERRLLPQGRRLQGGEHGHRTAELRGLAYHRAVAQRLDRALVDDALHRLRRWRSEGSIDERCAERWQEILCRPLPQVATLIAGDTPEARDLRQSSPFAGALYEPERRRILAMTQQAAA